MAARLHRSVGPARARLVVDAGRRSAVSGDPERTVVGDNVVLAEPVRCAFGRVHGVQIWIGPVDTPVRPKRRVAAWDWDAVTELAHHGPGLEELAFARESEQVQVVRTPPDAFGRMVRFDGRVDYFDMATKLEPGGHWQGEVDMLGDDDAVRRFQMVASARPTIDPTDFAALRAACADAARQPGTARRLAVRVRFAEGDWIQADAELVTITTAATGHGLLRVWSAGSDRPSDA
ncbi:DUF5593 domain-containing protein [Nocardia salmonicida]|uniref:DUF5593 domain-containing protein n=1 Tax=Nocardia salmonicida TaxID=53431 RepID=A0ABZ1N8G4_9NOCA